MTANKKKRDVYSLWLMPGGEVATRLRKLIARLSNEYSTPRFEPHVTLVGELGLPKAKAIERTKKLAARIEPLEVKLSEVAHLDQYFRCVFIKGYTTRDLMNANSIARVLFEQKNAEEYTPHLSLVYGILNSHTRQRIITDVGDRMDIEFFANEIYLYYTGGQPKNWHRVSIMPCGRHGSAIQYGKK